MFKDNWKLRILANWGLAGAPPIIGQIIVYYQPSYALPVVILSLSIGLVMALRFLRIVDFYLLGGLRYVTKQLNKMADEADISTEFKAKTEDEVGLLVDALGKAFKTFRGIIRAAKESTTKTAQASHVLAANTEQLKSMTAQVSNAITQVSQGATEQSKSALHVSTTMEDMAKSVQVIYSGATKQSGELQTNATIIKELANVIEDVATTAESVSALAVESAGAARDGKDIVGKTVDGMGLIRSTVMQTADKIEELGQSSRQIGEIVAVIEDIAEQTNLLALNAAIEAARAGEQGKGFAVVADEVRKLAERSAQATKEIAGLISKIQKGTSNAVDAMQSGTQTVQEGMSLAENAGASLQTIHDLINKVAGEITRMAGSSRNMVEKSSQVVKSIDNIREITDGNKAHTDMLATKSDEVLSEVTSITTIAEQTAASSQEVAASAQQQIATVEQLAVSAEVLAELAEKLNVEVGQFKTEKEKPGLSGTSTLSIASGGQSKESVISLARASR